MKKIAKELMLQQPSLVALITIGWILRASVEMGAEQSVAGVAAWAQRVYPSGSFSWMLAARKAAQARLAAARARHTIVRIL